LPRLFSAVCFGGYRAYLTTGYTRVVNILLALLTILLMAMITWQMGGAGPVVGGGLALVALVACALERGFSRFLPLTLSALGAFAALGAPFA